ncbi:MAG: transcription antitermination factor NusB [Candidatus Borkfalkiaceae bacterium]|nr:transcription antitermination factor NusB [Christensenellaceae bacterium]
MRKDAREAVYKILFGNLFNENDEEFRRLVYDEMKLSGSDRTFADNLFETVSAHREEIEGIIERNAKGYRFERIYPTDKCAMELAIAEIFFIDDIPPVVSIDEALSLVRKFSTEESLKFVNGVLAACKKEKEGAKT